MTIEPYIFSIFWLSFFFLIWTAHVYVSLMDVSPLLSLTQLVSNTLTRPLYGDWIDRPSHFSNNLKNNEKTTVTQRLRKTCTLTNIHFWFFFCPSLLGEKRICPSSTFPYSEWRRRRVTSGHYIPSKQMNSSRVPSYMKRDLHAGLNHFYVMTKKKEEEQQ